MSGPEYAPFAAALLLEVTSFFLLLAALDLPAGMGSRRVFAFGFLIFAGVHFFLLLVELGGLGIGTGVYINWQLLTYFGYKHGWFYQQESYTFPGRWFGLVPIGINCWGLVGGLLALLWNKDKPDVDRV